MDPANPPSQDNDEDRKARLRALFKGTSPLEAPPPTRDLPATEAPRAASVRMPLPRGTRKLGLGNRAAGTGPLTDLAWESPPPAPTWEAPPPASVWEVPSPASPFDAGLAALADELASLDTLVPPPPPPPPMPAPQGEWHGMPASSLDDILSEVTRLVGEVGPAPRLLVIEDDPTIAHTLGYMLGREGFAVESAADGLEAKHLIDTARPPALVLMDLLLPHLDGFQLIELIRRSPSWSRTPIVMLTSNTAEQDIVRALRAGANDYVTKPFQLTELIERLRRHCRVSA